jgi:hypothetical protein
MHRSMKIYIYIYLKRERKKEVIGLITIFINLVQSVKILSIAVLDVILVLVGNFTISE